MVTPPHPTQVRSACERCRRQKLRCSRQQGVTSSEPCARCQRLGFLCEAGSQRKIGRPGKGSAAPTPTGNAGGATASAAIPTLTNNTVDAASSTGLRTAATRSTTTTTATTATTNILGSSSFTATDPAIVVSPLETFSSEDSSPDAVLGSNGNAMAPDLLLDSLPLDPSWHPDFEEVFVSPAANWSLTIPKQPSPLSGAGDNMHSMARHLVRTSDASFESLSKVNSMLRSITMGLTESWASGNICEHPTMDGLPDMAIYQITIESLQEYLTTLKTIHRSGGSRPYMGSVTRPEPIAQWAGGRGAAPITYLQPSLDIPTTLLIVSCFVQIIGACESMLHMFDTFLKLTMGETLGNDGIAFAGVIVPEFTSQVIMFSQMVRLLLLQIYAVLGIPRHGRPRTVWAGLLSNERDRELLGKELGASSHQEWSDRPLKLVAGIEKLRNTLDEASMLSQF
ncbi:fungal zn(2)-Cys(6) binuclear cluster domain-containing protein [Sarocladium implicatum]|nr:fungal zn(2)-Cys(6) binuclear cluster domain-containing protein [Sarocladium implicatum]